VPFYYRSFYIKGYRQRSSRLDLAQALACVLSAFSPRLLLPFFFYQLFPPFPAQFTSFKTALESLLRELYESPPLRPRRSLIRPRYLFIIRGISVFRVPKTGTIGGYIGRSYPPSRIRNAYSAPAAPLSNKRSR
jgi:hypothetical protein